MFQRFGIGFCATRSEAVMITFTSMEHSHTILLVAIYRRLRQRSQTPFFDRGGVRVLLVVEPAWTVVDAESIDRTGVQRMSANLLGSPPSRILSAEIILPKRGVMELRLSCRTPINDLSFEETKSITYLCPCPNNEESRLRRDLLLLPSGKERKGGSFYSFAHPKSWSCL